MRIRSPLTARTLADTRWAFLLFRDLSSSRIAIVMWKVHTSTAAGLSGRAAHRAMSSRSHAARSESCAVLLVWDLTDSRVYGFHASPGVRYVCGGSWRAIDLPGVCVVGLPALILLAVIALVIVGTYYVVAASILREAPLLLGVIVLAAVALRVAILIAIR